MEKVQTHFRERLRLALGYFTDTVEKNIHKPGLKVFFLRCCQLLSQWCDYLAYLRKASLQHCTGSNEGEEAQRSFQTLQVSSLISSADLCRGQLNSMLIVSLIISLLSNLQLRFGSKYLQRYKGRVQKPESRVSSVRGGELLSANFFPLVFPDAMLICLLLKIGLQTVFFG